MTATAERQRIRELLERSEIVMLVSRDGDSGQAGRPMRPLWLAGDPHVYFLTRRDSAKVAQIGERGLSLRVRLPLKRLREEEVIRRLKPQVRQRLVVRLPHFAIDPDEPRDEIAEDEAKSESENSETSEETEEKTAGT